MPRVTIRLTQDDEILLNKAAKKARLNQSEYIRQILFASGSIAEKIDFYRTINLQIKDIVKQSVFTTQLLCQILLNQTDTETVQKIIDSVKAKLEEDEPYET
ncbi:MAG: hypothetical protein H6Q70_2075 [Firmicutes bacterium]|nr:hypothetical protein [Bacillota bacterium]